MMKFAKKVSYAILLTILLGAMIEVKAAECSPANTVSVRQTKKYGSSIKGGGSSIVNWAYSGNNEQYTAFCLDPELPGPNSGSVSYCVNKVQSSYTRSLTEYDKGLIYIYSNGYPKALSGGEGYEATNTALRLWSYYNGKGKGSTGKPAGSVYKGTNIPVYKNTVTKLINDPNGYGKTGRGGTEVLTGGAGLTKAFELFYGARNYSKTPNDEIWQPDLGAKLEKSNFKDVSKEPNAPWSIQTKLTITGLNNIDVANGGYVTNPRLVSKTSGATFSLSELDGSPVSGKNYAALADSKGNYTFNIFGNGSSGCNADFDIEYDYYDPRDSNMVIISSPKDSESNSSSLNALVYQRMVLIPNGGGTPSNPGGENPGGNGGVPKTKSSPLNIILCDGGTTGTACPPQFALSTSCPAWSDPDQTAYGFYKDPTNWETCIHNKKDEADNQYNIFEKSSSSTSTKGNPYCSAACREEYEFNLPGNIKDPNPIRGGHYFKMGRIEITGTRECMTSTIDLDSFRNDIHKANQAVVAAYNAYAEAKAKDEAAVESDKTWTGPGKSAVTCPPRAKNCTPQAAIPSQTGTYKEVKVTGSYVAYDYNNGSISARTVNFDETYGSVDCNVGQGQACVVTEPTVTTETLKANASSSKSGVDAALKQKDKYISYLKACNTGWTNNFDFDPLVLYDYEEKVYMDMIGGKNFMDGKQVDSSANDSYCASNPSATGDCAWGGSTNMNVNVIKCGENGCQTIPTAVPGNRAAKKNRIEKYTYQPYTVFYTKHPTGEITTKKNDGAVYSELGRVFPVSVLTPTGTYEYNLYFNNIGQYSDGSLGRIDSIAKKLNEKLQYTCNYKVEESCYVCPPEFEIDDGQAAGGLEFFYRAISLNDVFPNSNTDSNVNNGSVPSNYNRNVGINWTTEKAVATQKEIEEAKGYVNSDPQYSFKLTPSNMQKIKSYNQERENGKISNLGYSDFDLYCDKSGLECRSRFLDKGEESNLFSINREGKYNGRNMTFESWKSATGYIVGEGPAWK